MEATPFFFFEKIFLVVVVFFVYILEWMHFFIHCTQKDVQGGPSQWVARLPEQLPKPPMYEVLSSSLPFSIQVESSKLVLFLSDPVVHKRTMMLCKLGCTMPSKGL
ncbi:hypothetical protein JZ751_017685 [Albula glossodonta]|uniref:Uncharacterized protein n=1 Tax=Albula glossodonta TaxID=121402 RepID=A0A8T2PP35_9TELE|nr:hypothetical protein JZ751_017685 [Albula glossodonta]